MPKNTEAEESLPASVLKSKELKSRGLLSEADNILDEVVKNSNSTTPEILEWIKSSAIQGKYAEAHQRLKLAQKFHPELNWWPVEVDLMIRAKEFDSASGCLSRVALSNIDTDLYRQLNARLEKFKKIQDDINRRDNLTRVIEKTIKFIA